jgi:hypothetical protein
MDNLFVLMCFGALFLIALFAFLSMAGLMGRNRRISPYSSMGNEMPRFDDPNISSGGSFGGGRASSGGINLGGSSPTHHDPNIRSGGSFGG